MPRYALLGIIVTVFALTPPGRAHDYWLQPQRYFLSIGETTNVQLLVGDHFISEVERPFQARQTVDFQIISRKEARDLKAAAKDGMRPVCTIAPTRAGNHLIVMERDWSHIEIEAAKFNEYLAHEGHSSILEMRRKAGEDKTVGRERYRRYLKALVQVGQASDETYARTIGHRLEIVPRANPSNSAIGDRILVSVLFEGRPLREAQITAYSRQADNVRTQETTTDDRGQAQFKLHQSGLWLIRLVHIRRADNVSEVDWESFWAAYTFQLR